VPCTIRLADENRGFLLNALEADKSDIAAPSRAQSGATLGSDTTTT
jgi:hypothetical protein